MKIFDSKAKRQERIDEALAWYESLSENEKADMTIGYNTMILFLSKSGLGRKITMEQFIVKTFKTSKNLEAGKYTRTYEVLDRVGRVVLNEHKKE